MQFLPLSASTFIDTWKIYTEPIATSDGIIRPEFYDIWKNDELWTDHIYNGFGGSHSLKEHLERYFNLRPQYEDWKIDLIMGSHNNISGLQNMRNGPGQMTVGEQFFYPSHYELLLELENNRSTCWQEMYKLTQLRGRLKVLVTYDKEYYTDHQNFNVALEHLDSNFKSIIKQANDQFPENEQTEYLLIVGKPSLVPPNEDIRLDWVHLTYNPHELIAQ